MKRSPLGIGQKSLDRGSTFAAPRKPLRRSRMALTHRPIEGWSLDAKGEDRCRVCGGEAHHLHHAVPRSLSPAGRADLRNGLPICWPCHRAHHDGEPIPRSVFTADEWAFVSTLTGAGWLERRYPPIPDSTR